MVNAKSRRHPSVRLCLVLGALVLLALLLTMQPPPAQATSHVTSDQSCVSTSSNDADRRQAPSNTLINVNDLNKCFTNHGSGGLTFTTPTFNLVGRTDLALSDITETASYNSGSLGRLFVKPHPDSTLSMITPRLGVETATPDLFKFQYDVQVRATNSGGSTAEVWVHFKTLYTPSTSTVPLAPTLTAVASNGQVKLTWVSGGDGGAAITKWEWRQSADGTLDTETWTAIPSSGPTTTTHTVTGLTNGTAVLFQVRGRNSVGAGTQSAVVAATPRTVPSAPTSFTATAGNETVTLTWVSGGDGGAAITGWEFRCTTDGVLDSELLTPISDSAPGGAHATSFTLVSRLNNTEHLCQVRARNGVGVGALSAEASATPMAVTVPLAPSFLNVEASVRFIRLAWISGGDGGAAIDRWEYRQTTDGVLDDEPWIAIPDSATGGANQYDFRVTGLTSGTLYLFQVRAHNSVGSGAASPSRSEMLRPATVPAAPSHFQAAAGGGLVQLEWVAGDDGGAAIDRWEYRQTTDSVLDTEAWMAIPDSAPGGANANSFVVTGLTGGTLYYFQVRAHNSVGDGAPSVTKSLVPAVPPPAPTLTATAGNRQVTLTWVSGGDRGAAIDRWEYRQKAGNGSYGEWQQISGSGPATTQHEVRGLSNGTLYTFQVRAHTSEGAGPASAEVSATPRVLTRPARPTNLSATGGPGQVTLTWDAGTDDGGVAIDRWEYRQQAGSGAYGGWTLLSTDPTAVQHVLTSLIPHTRYTY